MMAYIKSANTERIRVKLATPTNFSLGLDNDSVVFGENSSRFRKIKAVYGPKKFWRNGWVIEPDLNNCKHYRHLCITPRPTSFADDIIILPILATTSMPK
jgi:hypothetical protein